jgi:dGTP triphosphohydrolase
MKLMNNIVGWIRGDTVVKTLQQQVDDLREQNLKLKQERNAADDLATRNKALFDGLNARIATISRSVELNLRDTSFGARHEQESAILSIKDVVAQQASNEITRMIYLTTKKNEQTGADIVTAVIRFLCPGK